MKHTKLSCLLLVAMLCISVLSGCGNTNPNQAPATNPPASADNTGAPSQSGANENEAAAEQLLQDLQGT